MREINPPDDDKSVTSQGRAIGVGCLWFSLKNDDGTKINESLEEIISSLSGLENLTDLDVEPRGSLTGDVVVVRNAWTKEVAYFPIAFDKLRFSIFIPSKVQREIGFECESEHFDVEIRSHYYMPVTYVTMRAKFTALCDPSLPLALIREYLRARPKIRLSDFSSL